MRFSAQAAAQTQRSPLITPMKLIFFDLFEHQAPFLQFVTCLSRIKNSLAPAKGWFRSPLNRLETVLPADSSRAAAKTRSEVGVDLCKE
jgi:hypothetical protein